MKVRDMLEKVMEKRIFTVNELVEEFYEEWGDVLPKSLIKKRLVEFLKKQLETNFIKKLYSTGHNCTIFAIKEVTPEELKEKLPCCKICGERFYPVQHNQTICGKLACEREYVRRFKRSKKGYEPEDRHYAHWKEEEIEELRKAFPGYKYNFKVALELAQKLKRHPAAIKTKLYILKRGGL